MPTPSTFAIAAVFLAITCMATQPVHSGGAVGRDNPTAVSGRWTLTALHGKETGTPAGDITFEPSDGTISGATACNFFRGAYETTGTTLTFKVGMMTRRGCSGVAAEFERAFLETLKQTRSYRIDTDQLILAGTDAKALARLVRTRDASLEGPRHKIVSYLNDGGLYSIRAETGAAITLDNGRIDGNTGCRTFTASYTRKGDALSIGSVVAAQTLAPCAENVRDQDQYILAGLPGVTAFDTSRNLIRLLQEPGGAAVLWITPQTP